jgi:hypothetical protein
MSGSSAPRNRVVLVAAFGSVHDAEAAARFLTDRGVPTKAIGLSKAATDSPYGPGDNRRVARPVIFAAFGGVFAGFVGNIVGSVFAPEFLTAGWRVIGFALVGATAAGSLGVAVDSGLESPLQDDQSAQRAVNSSRDAERAVVAVAEGHVERAAGLLRRIGVDRMLVGDEAM